MMARNGKRLRHRLPVSLRQHWKLVLASIATITVLAVGIGTLRVTALVYSDQAEGYSILYDIKGTQDLFDSTEAHDISIYINDHDYEEMIAEFEKSGEKEWVKVDLTIDGVTIEDVGMRLKGNSTLLSLGGGNESRGGPPGGGDFPDGFPPPGGGEFPDGFEPPENGQFPGGFPPGNGENPSEVPDGFEPPGGGEFPGPMDMGESSLDLEKPETLPWLVDFGKYVEGQVYQGNKQISLRVDSFMSRGSTLTEAVALDMIAASGASSYGWTYSTVSVNGSEAATRRIVDIMDVTWAADEFGSDAGVLYKARAGGGLEYKGDDPADYKDDFKQITMDGAADVQPIIDFVKWYDSADDATFAAELGEWFDIESLATYAAIQNLIVNGDDMSGPGNNYYLWYDFDSKLFTVITWDVDLSLQQSELSLHDTESMMDRGPVGIVDDTGKGPGDGAANDEPGGPGDGAPGDGPDDERPDGVRFSPMGGNDLKQRFLETTAFKETYLVVYQQLYEKLYASGVALTAVDTAEAAATLNGLDTAEEAERLRTLLTERAAFLESELNELD